MPSTGGGTGWPGRPWQRKLANHIVHSQPMAAAGTTRRTVISGSWVYWSATRRPGVELQRQRLEQ